MTKDEALAMDLALEALKQIYMAMPFPAGSKAITAIKQARSAPVQDCNLAEDGVCEALECCKQPAPVQEPVAWMFEDDEGDKHKTFRQTPPSPEDVAYIAKWNRPSWVPLYTTPPGGRQSEDRLTAAQEDIQRLSALVRAQQITIDKLEQARSAPVQVSPLEFVTMVMEKEHLVGEPLFWAEWPNKENT
jgi:hypothetical protein